MCLPLGQRDVQAIAGQLELGDLDNNTFKLNGQWEFYYGELLMPEQISQYQLDIINVPSDWRYFDYP